MRDSFGRLIESYGWRASAHRSIGDFLGAFEAQPRQCLVLDHNLPQQNGIDFLEAQGTTLAMPVIVVSGAENQRQRALLAGAHAYFDKPPDCTQLIATIAALFRALP